MFVSCKKESSHPLQVDYGIYWDSTNHNNYFSLDIAAKKYKNSQTAILQFTTDTVVTEIDVSGYSTGKSIFKLLSNDNNIIRIDTFKRNSQFSDTSIGSVPKRILFSFSSFSAHISYRLRAISNGKKTSQYE